MRGGHWGGRLIIDSWDPRRLLAAESIFTAKLNSINSESRAVMLAGSRGVVQIAPAAETGVERLRYHEGARTGLRSEGGQDV